MFHPSHKFKIHPDINSITVIMIELKNIWRIIGIFGVISLIAPMRIKHMPPTKNIVQWLNPRARTSIP